MQNIISLKEFLLFYDFLVVYKYEKYYFGASLETCFRTGPNNGGHPYLISTNTSIKSFLL